MTGGNRVITNKRASGDREGSRRQWAMIKGTADSEKALGTCKRSTSALDTWHWGSEVMGARHQVSRCNAAPWEVPCGSDHNWGPGAPASEFFFL